MSELDNVEIQALTEPESDSEDNNQHPQNFLIRFKKNLRDSVMLRFGTHPDSGQVPGRGRRIVTSNVVNDKFYILATVLDPKLKTIPFEGN